MTAHLTMPPPRPSVACDAVPATFDTVIAKGMAKDPNERYQTTLELADAARAALANPLPAPPPPPAEEPTVQWASAHPDVDPASPFAGDENPTVMTTSPAKRRPPWYRRRLVVMISAQAVVAIALVAAVLLWVERDAPTPTANAPEIFLEPATSAGENPFTPSASVEQQAPADPGPDPAGGPVASGEVRAVDGDLADLYGGSRNTITCNVDLLVSYFGQHSDVARAWAGAFNITAAQIPDFLGGLTSVLLRTDARVTSHFYANGRATSVQAVLQAGTAVLVDRFGVPKVRCAGGNPLLAPVATSSPTYSQTKWNTFSTKSLTVIRPSPKAMDHFVVYDAATKASFARPVGGTGTNDTDDPRIPVVSLPPTTETQVETPAPQVTDMPIAPQYEPSVTAIPTTLEAPPPNSSAP